MEKEELINLIKTGEGLKLEFKEGFNVPSLGKEMCAFANESGGKIIMNYYLNVVCAYCKKTYGYKTCVPEMHLKTSHGICKECEKKQIAIIEKMEKGGIRCI